MKVLSVCGFQPYWGSELPPDVLDLEKGPTVGGGEEAFLQTAVGLRALGHEVVGAWYAKSGSWRGVGFLGREAPLYQRLIGEPWDAVIAWSCLRPLEYAPKGARRLLAQQLNDCWIIGDWRSVDCTVSPSREHAARIFDAWGWKGNKAVVHNGCDIEEYADAPAWNERPNDVGYWSSPDRGLHWLLAAWPKVRKQVSDARLHVFYEIKRYLEMAITVPAGYYGYRGLGLAKLLGEAQVDESITFHGAVPRRQLAKTQKTCKVLAYPYDPFGFCEGFCGSVNQGLAAGCTVITTPRDALPSLYDGGVQWIQKSELDLDYVDFLANSIVRGLRDELPRQREVREAAPGIAARYTWRSAALEMERACAGEGWFK